MGKKSDKINWRESLLALCVQTVLLLSCVGILKVI